MLHILLTILKIIGIILAVILGILVLLVCIVLFVPVRYEIKAAYPGTFDEASAHVKVSWLLHIIRLQFDYENKESRFEFHPTFKKKEESEETSKEITEPEKIETKNETTTEAKTAATDVKEEVRPSDEKVKEVKSSKEKPQLTEKEKAVRKKMRPGLRDKFHNKIRNLRKKLEEFRKKIKYTFDTNCDKIKVICQKKDVVMDSLQKTYVKEALKKLKKEMVWIIRFLRPKQFSLDLHFGFEDPYQTGMTLAGLSMIYPFFGDHMNLKPEFEEQVMEGSFYIKGCLRVIHLVIFLVKMILDKNVRLTIREGMKIKNEL